LHHRTELVRRLEEQIALKGERDESGEGLKEAVGAKALDDEGTADGGSDGCERR
jgi:hypothetical protein